MPAPGKWAVSQIVDPREPTLPRYIVAHRQSEAPWIRVWEHRNKLQSKLAAWMRALSDDGVEPLARPLLGRSVGLDERSAHAVCQFYISLVSKMAGCGPGTIPDFLIVDVNHGPRRRPVTKVAKDGTPIIYRAVREAARAEGIAPVSIRRRISRGHRGPDGAAWL